MKKLFIVIALSFVLIGCGQDKIKCFEAVFNTFPNSKIHMIPGESFQFIVENKEGIYYIETMHMFSCDISQIYKIPIERRTK